MPVPSSSRALAPFAGVFAVALAVRLVTLWSWHDTALFSTPVGDARAYLAWASEIAAGDWFGPEVFYQAPLYPYFLAALHTLFGDGPWVVRAAQSVLGALGCGLLGLAGERFFSRRVGIAAGLGLALYAPAVYFDGLIQKATLDAVLFALLLLLFGHLVDRDRPRLAFGSGLVLGGLALARENALVLAPLAALFVAIAGPPRTPGRRALALGLLALGLALPLGAVGLRNQAIGGTFLITTAQLGPNLWIGNHPGASGRYEPLRPGRGDARFERDDARALAEQAEGRALSPAEVSDHFRERVLEYARERPGEFARGLARKWALVWNASELPDTEGIDAYAERSAPLRALQLVFGFGLIAPLAAVGWLSTRCDWRRLWVLYASLALLAGSVASFFVFARYRFTLVPVLMLFAGAGVIALADALRERRPRRVVELALAAGVAALFVHWPLAGTADSALTHFSVGSALLEQGRAREALPELDGAVAARPDFPQARLRLADALRETGDPMRALALCDAVLAADPCLADAHVSRALALGALGRGDEAIAALEAALALDAAHADAHNDLGNLYVQKRDSAEAITHYRRALALRPDDANFEANLGAGLLQAGSADEAIVHLERALALAPGHPTARLNRATTLVLLGRLDEGRRAYAEVIRLEPAGSPYAARARADLERLDSAP